MVKKSTNGVGGSTDPPIVACDHGATIEPINIIKKRRYMPLRGCSNFAAGGG
jgi:hypothetical protein